MAKYDQETSNQTTKEIPYTRNEQGDYEENHILHGNLRKDGVGQSVSCDCTSCRLMK